VLSHTVLTSDVSVTSYSEFSAVSPLSDSISYSDVDMTSARSSNFSRDHVTSWCWAEMMTSRLPVDG